MCVLCLWRAQEMSGSVPHFHLWGLTLVSALHCGLQARLASSFKETVPSHSPVSCRSAGIARARHHIQLFTRKGSGSSSTVRLAQLTLYWLGIYSPKHISFEVVMFHLVSIWNSRGTMKNKKNYWRKAVHYMLEIFPFIQLKNRFMSSSARVVI